MKQIKTKSYVKFAQLGGYPPGVTGRENYFQAPPEDINDRGTFPIIRDGRELNVTVDYTIDMNVGFGDNPNINIDRVIKVTDATNLDLPDFDLTDDEIQQIKDVIIDNGDFNQT